MAAVWVHEMVEELADAGTGGKQDVIAKYAKRVGKSVSQLYRIASQNGYRSGRKPRRDKGELRCGLTDQQVEQIAALLHTTARENKGPIMPVELALKLAADNGWIEPDQVSPSTMQRILREREISKRHLREATPHIEMRSLHPNHVHLVDVSVCIQYYLSKKRLRIIDERLLYKNKLHNIAKIKRRLLRYLVVDHFSGAFWLKYYNATGETADNLFDAFCEAWSPKQDPRLPFRGVPFFLLQDAGSANLSRQMTAFLGTLGIEQPPSLPHNPRRQGGVEGLHNLVEAWFESRLRIQPADDIEQLNDWALDFMIWYQSTRTHDRHGLTRTACWLQIQPEQLREVTDPQLLRDAYACPEIERTVDGTRSISFRNHTYRLRHVDGLRPGSKVGVVLRPLDWPQVTVRWNDTQYQVEPVVELPAELGGFKADAVVIGQEYAAQPETATQQATKRMENLAYGEERKKGDTPFAGMTVFGRDAAAVPNLVTLPKRGTPIDVGREVAARQIPIIELIKRIRDAGGELSADLNRDLRATFGPSVAVETADAVVDAIATGNDWRPAAGEGGQAQVL